MVEAKSNILANTLANALKRLTTALMKAGFGVALSSLAICSIVFTATDLAMAQGRPPIAVVPGGGPHGPIAPGQNGLPALDPYWTHCANEGEICNLPPDAIFRYGAGDRFLTYELRGGPVRCSFQSFGDPAVGVNKQCYYQMRPRGWTICASEGRLCNAPAGSLVIYGAQGRFSKPVRVSRALVCGLVSFGTDPAPGIVKSCLFQQ